MSLVAEYYRTVWALEPTTFHALDMVITRWASGVRLSAEEIQAAVGGAPQAAAERRAQAQAQGGGGVAVLPLYGILTPRAWNAQVDASTSLTSTELVAKSLRALVTDPSVSAVILDVDSPGGNAQGVQELADAIFTLRSEKPIVGVVNPTAASGGYWAVSQCSEVVMTPSAWAGSIGTFMSHDDLSGAMAQAGVKREYVYAGANKVEGNPTGPLTDETRAYMQALNDKQYAVFTRTVARGRGVGPDVVRSPEWGQGRMLLAQDAVAAGMADRVDTLEATIARLGKPQARRAVMSASVAQARLEALRLANPINA